MVLHFEIRQQGLHLYCYQTRIQNKFIGVWEDDYVCIVFYRLPKIDILKFTSVAESTGEGEDYRPCSVSPLGSIPDIVIKNYNS